MTAPEIAQLIGTGLGAAAATWAARMSARNGAKVTDSSAALSRLEEKVDAALGGITVVAADVRRLDRRIADVENQIVPPPPPFGRKALV